MQESLGEGCRNLVMCKTWTTQHPISLPHHLCLPSPLHRQVLVAVEGAKGGPNPALSFRMRLFYSNQPRRTKTVIWTTAFSSSAHHPAVITKVMSREVALRVFGVIFKEYLSFP